MNYQGKLKRNIPLYYLITFVSFLIFIIPIWVAYEQQYISFFQMSIIAAGRFALTALFEIPTGALADIIGRKTTVILGFVSEAIGMFIMVLAQDINWIIAAAITRGLADALRSGADSAIIYDSLKELNLESEFAKVKAKSSLILQLGMIISSLVAGYLYHVWDSLPYLLYGIAVLIAAFIALFMQEPKIDSDKFSIAGYLEQTKAGFIETAKTPYSKLLTLYYTIVGGVTWSTTVYLNQIYASSIGYNEVEKGWLFAIIRFVAAILIFRILKVNKLITKKTVFLLFPIVIILSTLTSLTGSIIVDTLLLFGLSIASSMRWVVLENYANEIFESKVRATALSTLNLYVNIIYVILVTLSGPVLENYNPQILYFGIGVFCLVTILPLGIVLSKRYGKRSLLS